MLPSLLNNIFTGLLKIQLLESSGVRQNHILSRDLKGYDIGNVNILLVEKFGYKKEKL